MDITTIILVIILLLVVYIAFRIGHTTGSFRKDREWQAQLPGVRQDAIKRSRAVIGGHFSEQMAPYLPDYPFAPTETKFLGKPIDLLVFKGSDQKNIDEVVFVEVKSGRSKLSPQEKNLKETIEQKRVRWVEYRIPEDLTKYRESDES